MSGVAAVSTLDSHMRLVRSSAPAVKLFLAVAVASVAGWTVWTYNRLARSVERLDASWAQVENVVQRRSDLVPNLVAATAASADFEGTIAGELARSRTAYLAADGRSAQIDAARGLDVALREADLAAESYPDLRASRAFANLRVELAGSNNRISVERARYNEAVREYRRLRSRFPMLLIARASGFPDREYY
jgi:LemA protein